MNEPTLHLGLELYLQAFFDLDGERSHGMGLVRIARSSIVDYALYLDLDYEEIEDMVFLVKAMDTAHLNRLQSQIDAKNKKT